MVRYRMDITHTFLRSVLVILFGVSYAVIWTQRLELMVLVHEMDRRQKLSRKLGVWSVKT